MIPNSFQEILNDSELGMAEMSLGHAHHNCFWPTEPNWGHLVESGALLSLPEKNDSALL